MARFRARLGAGGFTLGERARASFDRDSRFRVGPTVALTKLVTFRFAILMTLLAGCEVKPIAKAGAGASIAISVDGGEARNVDLALLTPDAEENGRRAWRLSTLYGEQWSARATIEVESLRGERRTFSVESDRELLLFRNQHGELLVTVAQTGEPFPGFHGRGGNRGRAGDPERVRGVVRVNLERSRS